jgi:hypothetical protein
MSEDHQDPIPYDPPRNRDEPGMRKGAQQHAEGMQGPKTRAKLLEQLHGGPQDEAAATAKSPPPATPAPGDGGA